MADERLRRLGRWVDFTSIMRGISTGTTDVNSITTFVESSIQQVLASLLARYSRMRFFAFITMPGMCNFLWNHSAFQQLTPTHGPDGWYLSMQTLHTYADELAQVAMSADAEQQVQSVERVKAMVRNCESEIYRLQHAAKVTADASCAGTI